MSQHAKHIRLENMLAGAPVDRLPVALWRHWPGDDQDADALALAHIKWQQDYDWDVVKVSPSSSFCLRDWGTEDRWTGHIEGTREYTRRVIIEADDWRQLQPLDPTQGMLGLTLRALRQTRAGLGPQVPILATIFSPLSQAKNLAGEERLLTHLRRDPTAVVQGLATITASTLRYIEAVKATGVDGIFYAVQHARYTRLNPAEYARFGRDDDLTLLNAVQDLWLNMLHVHGADAYLTPLADYPVALVNWHDRENGIDLTAGRQLLHAAVSGGVGRLTLHADTPDAALAEARDAWRQTDGRRWLLSTGCVIMTNTPTRNIRALREFAQRPA